MLKAEQIMTPQVVTIEPEATVQKAIDLLLAKEISGLPVVDGQNRLIGILTEYALLAMVYDKDVTHQKVSEHMTREVISIDADAAINQVADQFIVHRVRRLPVVKGDRLVGLISRTDVLRALCAAEAPVCSA